MNACERTYVQLHAKLSITELTNAYIYNIYDTQKNIEFITGNYFMVKVSVFFKILTIYLAF